MIIGDTWYGIWMIPGAEASREFDADGLPVWGRHPEHGYHHVCQRHQVLAQEAGPWFSVPEFDAWLSALPACPMKDELVRRRLLAADLVMGEASDRTAMLRHLEFMKMRWQFDQREQVLLPLARQGRRQSVANKVRAQRPRWPPEIEAHIARAKASGGSAKEQWPRLLNSLDRDGYTVREVATKKGKPAIEIDLPEGPRRLSLKAFENRKRGPESR